ncbi:hypothetical protein Tco_0592632 [Tanacetum coccineum]
MVEYQGSAGLLLQPELPEYKWGRITKDIVVKLPSGSTGYDAIRVSKVIAVGFGLWKLVKIKVDKTLCFVEELRVEKDSLFVKEQ